MAKTNQQKIATANPLGQLPSEARLLRKNTSITFIRRDLDAWMASTKTGSKAI